MVGVMMGGGCTRSPRSVNAPFCYPSAVKNDQVDDYHGVKVADPYRWLEDENAADTKAWIRAQNEITFGYLAEIPERSRIEARLTELWNYEKYEIPIRKAGRYFFSRNDGLQNQSVLYTTTALDIEPTILLDPNTLSDDGTVALKDYAVSEDGKLMAYGLSAAGSDWQTWHVRNVETGKDLVDRIEWVKFSSASWDHAGKGFYYSRYDKPDEQARLSGVNYFQKLYYHRLGTDQRDDALIYHRPDHKDWGFDGHVTDDGRYLIVDIWQGTERKNRVYYTDLTDEMNTVVELLDDFDAEYSFIDNEGPVFWFRTDLGAPRGRVVAIDIREPHREHWREVIPQAAETLRSVDLVADRFIASYLEDAHAKVAVHGLDGKHIEDIALPGMGTTDGFSGRRTDRETFYSFTGFSTPRTIYRYDAESGASTVFRRPEVAFDSDRYTTRQVFYSSKDGTQVPMFITHKKELKQDGTNPTYLYGYGGFKISITPFFSVSNLVWMEMGGVLAVPNLRGGGEYGQAWHDAGRKLNKQNVFDDYIAAAEWLIANRYTSSDKLAIAGGSNGGLLVGACMTQRPELFAAAIPAVGVLDMLRFHKFTIGWAWTSDYGSVDNEDEFKALYAYSPLHNLEPGTAYPATLLMTADHDDRVVPAHSFKFAAALQSAQAGPAPTLIRIETRAGHGAGKPTSKRIEEAADKWAFLVRVLGM
jgi:prolyl oligopeptidase